MDLAELWARIKVDASGLSHGLADAKGQLGAFGVRLDGMQRRATYAFAAIAGSGYLMIKAFAQDEKSAAMLGLTLASTTRNAGDMKTKLLGLSEALMKQTVHSHSAIEAAMTFGLNMGILADDMPKATRNAIGLSTALGIDLQSAMRLTALAMQGEFALLARYSPAIRTAGTDTEKMARFQELAARGYSAAQGEVNTLSGSIAQLRNQFDELLETLGKAFQPMIQSFIGSIRDLIPVLQQWISANEVAIESGTKAAVVGYILGGKRGAAVLGAVVGGAAAGTEWWYRDQAGIARGEEAEAWSKKINNIARARKAEKEKKEVASWGSFGTMPSARAVSEGGTTAQSIAEDMLRAEEEQAELAKKRGTQLKEIWAAEMEYAVEAERGKVGIAGGRVTSAQDALRAAEEAAGRRPSFAGLEDFTRRIQLALAGGPQDEAVVVAKQQLEVEEKALALQEKELAALENAGKVLVD